jgi:hypothetical protein
MMFLLVNFGDGGNSVGDLSALVFGERLQHRCHKEFMKQGSERMNHSCTPVWAPPPQSIRELGFFIAWPFALAIFIFDPVHRVRT